MYDASLTLTDFDPELAEALQNEERRQEDRVELIASENYASPLVMAIQNTVFTNKYAEGYPGKRYYSGCENVDVAERLAIERVKTLFDCDYANVQPHAGAQANAAVYLALTSPGDTVMGMNLAQGGHLTHGSPSNFSGRHYKIVPYGLDPKTGLIDYDDMERIALETRPKILIGGFSAYSRRKDWARMRAIADKVGAFFWVDMAHVASVPADSASGRPLANPSSSIAAMRRLPKAWTIGRVGALTGRAVYPPVPAPLPFEAGTRLPNRAEAYDALTPCRRRCACQRPFPRPSTAIRRSRTSSLSCRPRSSPLWASPSWSTRA